LFNQLSHTGGFVYIRWTFSDAPSFSRPWRFNSGPARKSGTATVGTWKPTQSCCFISLPSSSRIAPWLRCVQRFSAQAFFFRGFFAFCVAGAVTVPTHQHKNVAITSFSHYIMSGRLYPKKATMASSVLYAGGWNEMCASASPARPLMPTDNNGKGAHFSPHAQPLRWLRACLPPMGIKGARRYGFDLDGLQMNVEKQMKPRAASVWLVLIDLRRPML